jgi:hypothetical protein
MNAILSVVKNDRIEVDAPPDWPEGSLVHVGLEIKAMEKLDVGRPLTPEEIEEKIRRLDAITPVMTPEEEAAWAANRKADRELEIANRAAYDKRFEDLYSREKVSTRHGDYERLDE